MTGRDAHFSPAVCGQVAGRRSSSACPSPLRMQPDKKTHCTNLDRPGWNQPDLPQSFVANHGRVHSPDQPARSYQGSNALLSAYARSLRQRAALRRSDISRVSRCVSPPLVGHVYAPALIVLALACREEVTLVTSGSLSFASFYTLRALSFPTLGSRPSHSDLTGSGFRGTLLLLRQFLWRHDEPGQRMEPGRGVMVVEFLPSARRRGESLGVQLPAELWPPSTPDFDTAYDVYL
jgi:hypothetical protein